VLGKGRSCSRRPRRLHPTCNDHHLPFRHAGRRLLAKGVDRIACIAVTTPSSWAPGHARYGRQDVCWPTHGEFTAAVARLDSPAPASAPVRSATPPSSGRRCEGPLVEDTGVTSAPPTRCSSPVGTPSRSRSAASSGESRASLPGFTRSHGRPRCRRRKEATNWREPPVPRDGWLLAVGGALPGARRRLRSSGSDWAVTRSMDRPVRSASRSSSA